jgi:hypothetical protein
VGGDRRYLRVVVGEAVEAQSIGGHVRSLTDGSTFTETRPRTQSPGMPAPQSLTSMDFEQGPNVAFVGDTPLQASGLFDWQGVGGPKGHREGVRRWNACRRPSRVRVVMAVRGGLLARTRRSPDDRTAPACATRPY